VQFEGIRIANGAPLFYASAIDRRVNGALRIAETVTWPIPSSATTSFGMQSRRVAAAAEHHHFHYSLAAFLGPPSFVTDAM
jgi:hypothetical protein